MGEIEKGTNNRALLDCISDGKIMFEKQSVEEDLAVHIGDKRFRMPMPLDNLTKYIKTKFPEDAKAVEK